MAYVLSYNRETTLELPAAEAIVVGDVLCITAASSLTGVPDNAPVFSKANAATAGLKRPTFVAVTAQATAGSKVVGARFADIEGLSPAGSSPAAGDAVFQTPSTAGGITKAITTTSDQGVVCVGILLSSTRCLFSMAAPPPIAYHATATGKLL